MTRCRRTSSILLALAALGVCGCGDATADQPAPAHVPSVTPVPEDETRASVPDVRLSPAFPRLSFARPVFLTHAGDDSGRLFVVEQPGRVRVFEGRPDVAGAEVFLDLKARVRTRHNEEGLLALAFHPQYAENGRFFVCYTASSPRRSVLSEFTASPPGSHRVDASTERVLLEVPQPYGNHNGSTVLFGPDGMLYASLGDGGSAADPRGFGQDLTSLLGTVIRLDVDRADEGRAYAIPADNPFVDRPGVRGEIWAYGLRNVWRMSFDREGGDLWAGDVGQDRWEEIDLIRRGGNYGWNLREGRYPFRDGAAPADPLVEPVAAYGREDGVSVTGGYVYRGSREPALRGVYLYADYVSGRIWGLRHDGTGVTAHRSVLTSRRREHITSFGEGPDGELYVCVFDRHDGRYGRIMRVHAGS